MMQVVIHSLSLLTWAIVQVPETQIADALKLGATARSIPSPGCYAKSYFLDTNGFSVSLTGPILRIARAAYEAKAKYQTLTVDQLNDVTKADVVRLVAYPSKPSLNQGRWILTPAATHAVLKRKDAKGDNPVDVLQPLSVETFEESWTNAVGGKFDGQGVIATFDREAFSKITWADTEVVIVTARGERTCGINAKERGQVR